MDGDFLALQVLRNCYLAQQFIRFGDYYTESTLKTMYAKVEYFWWI